MIGIGWSWTALVASECHLNVSYTCPTEINFFTFVMYFVMSVLYILLCGLGFHYLQENYRLHMRADMLINISEGYSKGVFSHLDKDKDGDIGGEDLYEYIMTTGINPEPFMHAFHDIDVAEDGHQDHEVDIPQLMAQFTQLMEEIRRGSYSPESSLAVHVLDTMLEHDEKAVVDPGVKARKKREEAEKKILRKERRKLEKHQQKTEKKAAARKMVEDRLKYGIDGGSKAPVVPKLNTKNLQV